MKKKVAIGSVIAIIFFILALYFSIFAGLPASYSVVEGDESTLLLDFPLNLYIDGQGDHKLEVNGKLLGSKLFVLEPGDPLVIKSNKIGQTTLNLKLFGIIPLKTITLNVLPDVDVYPGGQAIGVLLRSKGVMIVGRSYVDSPDGHRYYPAREAGMEVGDTILAINRQPVNDKRELAQLIQKYAQESDYLSFKVKKRSGKVKNIKVKPVKNKNGKYMIGLFVDDGVAGVGTLTFYDTNTMEFGALGHEITEANSRKKIDVREGRIIEAQISGINSGMRGSPGEKLGTFFQNENILGNIKENNKFGIYGILRKIPKNPYFKKPIPVAPISQIKTGPAKIYTVVKGGKIEEFSINIDRIYRQAYPADKGMIITITDPELKRITGGIIQGMSGSPIIQNNMLVGAITHVFVNNPTRGYAVFAEWMLLQTDIYEHARASSF